MYNRTERILEQYPFQVRQTYKGRGVIICDTDQGMKALVEYRGSQPRADFLYQLLDFLRARGQRVDAIARTKEDSTLAVDADETAYLVKDWYEGKECDTRDREDILRTIEGLAELHQVLREYREPVPEFLQARPEALLEENMRHSRELKKVRNYIAAKRKKNDFELEYMRNCGSFLAQAEEVQELQRKLLDQKQQETRSWGICHGEFNHHNVVNTREGLSIVNFERAVYDVQIGDFCNFMRKILEKHNWNMGLGMDMLNTYSRVRSLESQELQQLYIRLAFPEKFWKISNHYYNTSKAWVCGRNLEKLQKVIFQNPARESFLKLISHNLLF